MDLFSSPIDVLTFIFGKPCNPLQSVCSTVRDILILVCIILYRSVGFSDKDYLLCLVLQESKIGFQNITKTLIPQKGDSMINDTHFIHHEGGKFSVYPNLPYITNACKEEIRWPVNFSSICYLYPAIMLFFRRALDHFLDIRKSRVLKEFSEIPELKYDEIFGSFTADDPNQEKHPVILGIKNEIEDERGSFFERDVRRMILGIVPHSIAIIPLLLYWCYRFNWSGLCGTFESPFVCQNPGLFFPDKRTLVECSFDNDRLSEMVFCLGIASCFVVADVILASIDLWREWRLWHDLGRQLGSSTGSSEVDVNERILKNFRYIVGCRRDTDRLRAPEIIEQQTEIEQITFNSDDENEIMPSQQSQGYEQRVRRVRRRVE